MTELAVYFPREIGIIAEQTISDATLPLLPANKIVGTLHPDRIPPLPVGKIEGLSSDSVSAHLNTPDPHTQYAKETDFSSLYEEVQDIQAILTANNLTL